MDISDTTIIAISAGDNYILVLDKYGNVYSFGFNNSGQLGYNKPSYSTARKNPNQITVNGIDNLNIIAVSAGWKYSLVLDENGHVYSFGINSDAQLGKPETGWDQNQVPTQITANGINTKIIIAISAGVCHSILLDHDGYTHCFGLNDYGQLGDTSTELTYKKLEQFKSDNLLISNYDIHYNAHRWHQIVPGCAFDDKIAAEGRVVKTVESSSNIPIFNTGQILPNFIHSDLYQGSYAAPWNWKEGSAEQDNKDPERIILT